MGKSQNRKLLFMSLLHVVLLLATGLVTKIWGDNEPVEITSSSNPQSEPSINDYCRLPAGSACSQPL